MIQTIVQTLSLAGIKWTVNGIIKSPDETDIRDALDDLAVQLLDAETGDRLSVGGLVVEKTIRGQDVYVYVGEYL